MRIYKTNKSGVAIFKYSFFLRTVLALEKSWEGNTESFHGPHIQALLLLTSYTSTIYLLQLMHHHYH